MATRGKDDRIHELRSEYEAVQKKTFTKWANSFLKERNMQIGELYTDLQDGRMLIALLEQLSNETLVCGFASTSSTALFAFKFIFYALMEYDNVRTFSQNQAKDPCAFTKSNR
jgi:hypothetical protein